MKKRIALCALTLLVLGACSPKEPIQNDPWMESAPDPVTYEAESDTLTYDFLAEGGSEAADEVSPAPDLPVVDEEPPPAEHPVVTPPPPPVEQVEVVPPEPSGPLFYVQIFASNSRKSAEELALKADARLEPTVRILYMEPYYKVLVGGYLDREDAVNLRRDLTDMGYQGSWIFEH